MDKAHFWSGMEVQQVMLEVTVVMAVFKEDCAILGNGWLVTESDWPLEPSIWDRKADGKACSMGILVLFKVDTRLVGCL
jgi:hypothetical protein